MLVFFKKASVHTLPRQAIFFFVKRSQILGSELAKNTNGLGQDSLSPYRESNVVPPEYEAAEITTAFDILIRGKK
jgi:hypothetical protein